MDWCRRTKCRNKHRAADVYLIDRHLNGGKRCAAQTGIGIVTGGGDIADCGADGAALATSIATHTAAAIAAAIIMVVQNNYSNNRVLTIDALRGIALFGILAINIQSFVWGLSGPTLGMLDANSSAADLATVFFSALLLEYKFYPIFCFCFGYGFMTQTRRWTRHQENAQTRFTQRLNIMLIMGALHGIFLYFGDVLSRYALTGYILRHYAGSGPRRLLAATKFWFWVTVMITLVTAILTGLISLDLFADDGALNTATLATDATNATKAEAIKLIRSTINIYATGSYADITWQRMQDYLTITVYFIFSMPQLMLLFLLGALTAKMGWLSTLNWHDKYRARWTKILLISLAIGLPINFFYAMSAVELARDPGNLPGFIHILLSGFIPVLAFAYIAGAALAATSTAGTRVLSVFAAAGKIALTNYLAQSIIVGFLLYGYGYGYGAEGVFTQFPLLMLALVIYTLQVLFSHIYLRYFSIGPMEILWRKFS